MTDQAHHGFSIIFEIPDSIIQDLGNNQAVPQIEFRVKRLGEREVGPLVPQPTGAVDFLGGVLLTYLESPYLGAGL
jgi:hypothetical protein